jgi:tRNA(Ile)-lysidine synthase
MDLLEKFIRYTEQKNLFSLKDKLLLAVSGGADSTVLCDLCYKAGFDFAIAHCNFQLRGSESDSDDQFVKGLAKKYNVVFHSKAFDTKKIAAEQKTSIEETARNLRYAWFNELLTPGSQLPTPDFLLTGHHADDNIETVAMKFFRGTGMKGMRGILPKNGKIVRPLLFARRKDIEEYALQNQLEFVTDHTNLEETYTRNFFRNRILPLVREFFPEAEQNILNNAKRFVEMEELYDQAIAFHKSKLLEVKGAEIHIPVLKLKKSKPLHSITYEIIKDFGFTAYQTDEVIALLDSETGKYVASSTHRIIRNRKWLIIATTKQEEAKTVVIEQVDKKILFEAGTLQLEVTSNQQPVTSNYIACLDLKEIHFPLLLRKWKTGDYFYPLGMKKKKKLARFLIDQKLSKTQKENVWVIESDKRILWVVGHRIDDRFKITDKTREVFSIKFIISGQTV